LWRPLGSVAASLPRPPLDLLPLIGLTRVVSSSLLSFHISALLLDLLGGFVLLNKFLNSLGSRAVLWSSVAPSIHPPPIPIRLISPKCRFLDFWKRRWLKCHIKTFNAAHSIIHDGASTSLASINLLTDSFKLCTYVLTKLSAD
jgi:hypothetical protein